MRVNLQDSYLSKARYRRYLIASGNDEYRAWRLYNANISLSQAFHPIISQFEVIFRNSVDTALTKYFSDEDWIINEKAGFMNDKSLGKSNFYLRRCVEVAESKLRKAKVHISSGKVISDQAFGFWTAFFEPHHYKLMHGQPIHVFNNKPATENRASIYRKLEMIRAFRNRVNHCEPLCFVAHDIDCSQALDVKIKLFNLIEWIDPGLIPFFASMDHIQDRIDQIRSI